MDELELNRVVDAWVAGSEAENGTPEHERNWWAVSQVIDWALEGDSDRLWLFILTTYRRNISDRVVSLLAAGPLEDLLAKHGPKFIERVEELARQDQKFNSLLGGVWQNTMTDEVWKRVQAARKEIW
jgi:hypothetical protein